MEMEERKSSKKIIAIITARGGSKRIPRKNIKEFCGKPIIEYPINAALQSGIFDEVMVSTDDEEIAQISKSAGANVPFLRSEKTSNDFALTRDVLMEVLMEYEKRGKNDSRSEEKSRKKAPYDRTFHYDCSVPAGRSAYRKRNQPSAESQCQRVTNFQSEQSDREGKAAYR